MYKHICVEHSKCVYFMVVFARRIPRENARGLAFVASRLANGILYCCRRETSRKSYDDSIVAGRIRQSNLHFAKYHPRFHTATQCTYGDNIIRFVVRIPIVFLAISTDSVYAFLILADFAICMFEYLCLFCMCVFCIRFCRSTFVNELEVFLPVTYTRRRVCNMLIVV